MSIDSPVSGIGHSNSRAGGNLLAKESVALALIEEAGPAVIAYSGGVDSTLVAALATEVLGHPTHGIGALAVMGRSPAVSPVEIAAAAATASAVGIEMRIVDTHEIDVDQYVVNGSDRCYHCKTELYAVCAAVATETGRDSILNGTNDDDLDDHRPGLVAAGEAAVLAPLAEAGITKSEVRELAESRGLPNWNKPAQPCLASRLPYGTAVTMGRLRSVDLVEQHLRDRGFRDVRARHHGARVRLEVNHDQVPALRSLVADDDTLAGVAGTAGFSQLEVEDGGFRSGRLNDELPSVRRSDLP